eukprot:1088342-Pelagomonas_calceolata.AAC.1
MAFLQMAHPVVESHWHVELERLWGLPSQQPPNEDAIVHGSFRALQRHCVFPLFGDKTGGHMQGSPSAHQ